MYTRIIFTAFAVLVFTSTPAAGSLARTPTPGEATQPSISAAAERVPIEAHTVPVVADSTAQWGEAAPTIKVTALAVKHKAAPKIVTARQHGYSFAVNITGGQAAIDRCDGFVWQDFHASGTVVSAHNTCGGAVILTLDIGDRVTLTGHGAGTYRVTQVKAVPKQTNSSVLGGHLWMQTCYFGKAMLRLVRLTPVD